MTSRPPIEPNACVQPSTRSRCFGSGKSSASQAVAGDELDAHADERRAAQERAASGRLVVNPAANAENA